MGKVAELVEQGVTESLSCDALFGAATAADRSSRSSPRSDGMYLCLALSQESALNLAAAAASIVGTHWLPRRYLDLQPPHEAKLAST
jgi:hypothetical protein